MVSLPAELVAAAILVDFWSSINNAVWITIFGLLLIASNSILVRIYGELEFFFASLKILLIVGVNIMALVIVCGGGPDHHTYGFQYWRRPGPLVQYLGIEGSTGRFLGEFFFAREWCWVELIYWLPTNCFSLSLYFSLQASGQSSIMPYTPTPASKTSPSRPPRRAILAETSPSQRSEFSGEWESSTCYPYSWSVSSCPAPTRICSIHPAQQQHRLL